MTYVQFILHKKWTIDKKGSGLSVKIIMYDKHANDSVFRTAVIC